jgi:hypothetical protein
MLVLLLLLLLLLVMLVMAMSLCLQPTLVHLLFSVIVTINDNVLAAAASEYAFSHLARSLWSRLFWGGGCRRHRRRLSGCGRSRSSSSAGRLLKLH